MLMGYPLYSCLRLYRGLLYGVQGALLLVSFSYLKVRMEGVKSMIGGTVKCFGRGLMVEVWVVDYTGGLLLWVMLVLCIVGSMRKDLLALAA